MMHEDLLATLAEMGCYALDRFRRAVVSASSSHGARVTAAQVQWVTKAAQRHGIAGGDVFVVGL